MEININILGELRRLVCHNSILKGSLRYKSFGGVGD